MQSKFKVGQLVKVNGISSYFISEGFIKDLYYNEEDKEYFYFVVNRSGDGTEHGTSPIGEKYLRLIK